MFTFWGQDLRGSGTGLGETLLETPVATPQLIATASGETSPTSPATPMSLVSEDFPKKRRQSVDVIEQQEPCAKRARYAPSDQLPSPGGASSTESLEDSDRHGSVGSCMSPAGRAASDESARDVIEHHFSLEVLLKHNELRLINQELAKCQIALEQLRRCHLIPFPVSCPTPKQMLDISCGRGPALQPRYGHSVPQWAPPFGVVEGPYARHYAKWLIPDPRFDGIVPPCSCPSSSIRLSKHIAAEGRTTRNSSDLGSTGKRPVRGLSGQKLQALSSGYPQPKDKQSPCILKRSDGQTVKLICIDCHRWDFSSTQGFINHCRIAHRRDFKSHEEAAVHCGHPIEVDDVSGVVSDEQKTPTTSTPSVSGLVHSFARSEPVSNQHAYTALQSRISDSLALYRAGQHPNVKSVPTTRSQATGSQNLSTTFVGSSDVPFLSRWMQEKKLKINLGKQVRDARTKLDDEEEELLALDEWEDIDSAGASVPKNLSTAVARMPVVSSVPALTRASMSPPPEPSIHAPSKNRMHPPQLGFPSADAEGEPSVYDDDMEIDLSPNTIASNNAPSLVSDDGEYDDSDDGSSSETSEQMEGEPESDVAEINIDEDEISPALRRRSSSSVQLKKAESKHVTFVTPHLASNPKGRRKPQNV